MQQKHVLWIIAYSFITLGSCTKNSAQQVAPAPANSTPQYELNWTEDFNTPRLDTSAWYYRQPGVRHDGYDDSTAVSLDNKSNLLIQVYSDTINGTVTHHTAMLATKRQFLYGKFEARVAFTNQSGSWSAFWLQSDAMGTLIGNPQQSGMEIDVVETLTQDGRAHENLHWDGYGTSHKQAGTITSDLGVNSGNYHLYTLEWTPQFYKFYVDGQLTWTYTANVSQHSEYIILSSEVMNYTPGSWAGPIPAGGFGSKSSSTTLMKVDYVKYYTLKQ